jgi:hypothetical protein
MNDLSVEVGHPNGAYYKVNYTKKNVIFPNENIFFRLMFTMWMQPVLMSNMIKSKKMKIKIK